MSIKVALRQLTQQAFGKPGFPDIPDYDLSQIGMNATTTDAIGRPLFMDMIFVSDKLGEEFVFPNEPLVSVSKEKNLVETVIAGNDEDPGGTVIEQINKGNFKVMIRGIILNEELTTPQYPQKQVKKLVEFCESSEPIGVKCDLLSVLFGINALVIRSYDIDEMQGKPYSQRFSIECTSYEDLLAQITLQDLDE